MLRPFLGKWRLHHQAVDQHEAFVKDAAAAGVPIVPIPGAASAYRPFKQQEQLFFQRYSKGAGKSNKTYNGVVYHLNPGMAMAAVPGTSGHGWGLAVDYMNANGTAINLAQRAKLRAIGAKYAIVDSVKSENWHFTCTNAQMVVGYQAPAPEAPPAVEPEPVFGDGGGKLFGIGSTGPLVAWIQQVVHEKSGFDVGKYDGKFGPRTQEGVSLIQKFIKGSDPVAWCALRTDGIVDEATWNILGWMWGGFPA